MPWAAVGAAVGAAGSIGGGLLSSNASSNAAKQQEQAQQNSLNWIKQIYGDTSGNLSPYIGAGKSAVGSLLSLYGLPGGTPQGVTGGAIGAGGAGGAIGSPGVSATGPGAVFNQFTQTPGYQFPLQQANLATNRALASSGLVGSGAQLRDLSQLNAGYASQGFGQFVSGLQNLASSGQNAASSLGSIGVGTGAQIGAANTNIGNAGAIGTVNSASGITSGINNALPFLTGQGSSSYNSGGLIGSLSGAFSGSGPFSANSLNTNFGTQFGAGTFPSASNPNAIPPGYQADTYTPA